MALVKEMEVPGLQQEGPLLTKASLAKAPAEYLTSDQKANTEPWIQHYFPEGQTRPYDGTSMTLN